MLRPRFGFFLALAALSGALYACSASTGSKTTGTTSSSTTSSSSGAGGEGGHGATSSSHAATGAGGDINLDGGTGSGGGVPMKDCKESTKLIYIVDQSNELYSFDPPKLAVQQIGTINCPTGGFATPFSMAVDRQGIAWVLFTDGHIYWVDTVTADCKASPFQPAQDPNFQQFGMGYVADMSGSSAETLYIASIAGSGVAKIDPQTLKVVPQGMYDQIHTSAELTGTGDARLFGFFSQGAKPGDPPLIAEIDKTNSHVLSQASQKSVTIGSGWAFAFWGGSFYMFTAPAGKSQVDKYDPMAGTTVTVLPGIGNGVIVGAGVSTCAPIKPPA